MKKTAKKSAGQKKLKPAANKKAVKKSPVKMKPAKKTTAKKKTAAKKTATAKSVTPASKKSLPVSHTTERGSSTVSAVRTKHLDRTKKLTPPEKRIAEHQLQYPGYKAYAPEEDIMNQGKRTEAELDYPKGSPKVTPKKPRPVTDDADDLLDEPVKKTRKGPNDVTKEDLLALGDDELESDGGDDEDLKKRSTPVDFAGDDLDIPEDDDDRSPNEAGSEDEENKMYSLGGDNHDDLEEDRT